MSMNPISWSPSRRIVPPLGAVAVPILLAAGCEAPPTVDGVRLAAPAPMAGFDAVETSSIRARTAFLASDFMEGRAPGTRGGELAAAYIATEFRRMGLEPGAGSDGASAGDVAGYFQDVPIVGVDPAPSLSFRSSDGRVSFRPAYLEDFVAWTPRQRERVDFSGDLVFVGHGIVAPEEDWDDYGDVDVSGRILLGLVNDPGGAGVEGRFRGDTLTYYGRWTYKFEEAARQGAAGMLLVHTEESAGYGWSVVRNSWSGTQFELSLEEGASPMVVEGWLSREATGRLLGMANLDLASLEAEARSPDFTARELPLRASGQVESEIRRITSPNVLAFLEGRDEEVRDEVVVYTAHYDHLGMEVTPEGDTLIYNGARDNASGTAALLELAGAYARSPERPRRSVMFAAVTAEESGLLGSAHLAAHPPRGRFVANLNLDALNMWGPTRDIVPLGAEHSTLGETFRGVARFMDLEVRGDPSPEQGFFFRSDQFSFVRQGVPALYVEQGWDFIGEPEDTGAAREGEYRRERYHQPGDEMLPEYTMEGAAQQARAAFLTGWVVANAERAPRWLPGSPFGGAAEASGQAVDAGTPVPAAGIQR